MRIAIVSDVHGNLAALEAVISDLDARSPDLVLHGGDLAVTGPRPAAAVDLIRERGWPGVLGNTDEILFNPGVEADQEFQAPKLRGWLQILFQVLAPWARERLGADRIEWLRQLPTTSRCDRLVVVHAAPGNLWRAPMPDATAEELIAVYGAMDADLVVCGHIHRPYVRQVGDLTVANSGSVGLPYDGDSRASYLVVDDGTPTVRRVEYDLERARRDAAETGFPLASWLAQIQRSARFVAP